MTRAEKLLASRLLEVAAAEFHEHGCNDMDPECFHGISASEIAELVDAFNHYRVSEHGDIDVWEFHSIGDDKWMEYLAYRVTGGKWGLRS
jgi:hypothetical protein